MHRLRQVVVVFLTQLAHTVLAVQSLSNYLVCLHKLVDFASELVVLVADYADVIVHGVNLDLEIGIVLEECTVRVTSTFQFLSHVQKLILFLTDLHL